MTNFFKGKFGTLTWAIALALFTTATPAAAQTIGMVIDGAFDAAFTPTAPGVHVFNADTRQVLASFPTTADAGDCSISADGSTGYFTRTDGLNSTFNEVQIVDLTIPMLGSVIEVPTAPAQDTALSADGRFLVICDGAGTAKPITVVDTAAGPAAIVSTFQPTDLSGVTSCTAVAVCDNNDVLITTKGAIPDVQRLQLDGSGVLTEYGPADRYTGLLGSDVPQDVLCGPGGTTAVVVLQNFFAPEVLSFTTNPLTLADSRALLDRGIAPDVPPGPALVGGASAMNAAGNRVYVRSWLNSFVDPSSCSAPLTGDPTVEACGVIQVHSFNAASGLFGDPTPDEDVIGPIRIETQGFGIDSIAVHPDGTRLFVSEHAGFDPLTFLPTGTPASVNVYNTADGSLIGPLSDTADGTDPSTAIEAPTGLCIVAGSAAALTPQQQIEAVISDLALIIGGNPDSDAADKIEDVIDKLRDALEELDEEPPIDKDNVVGHLEGAVGDLEAAVKDGLLGAAEGTALLDQLTGVARQLAADALAEAIAQGGDPGDIADAQEALDEGDALRASGDFKDAVNKYKDALSKAESAIN